ncbi:M28 family peptidase [Flammeovirga yaeyamensis]|uniref:M28 family peptidase n=1 Tax=Flammeovirga yaeyamensis TaxID=367791 RepID=A0AAX1N511_9BACT|nr:M28 family peptidase [Flammeovirga yaeyamensis]MBB3700109.1 hypothetical protein [Flammeovirga yaeyamensis]NMF37260.1 M28 family peptidase [Flammeovirga yaeyamensis]QWG00948.1 M28 family peptidase [Flammeovirga yaeyamensis]
MRVLQIIQFNFIALLLLSSEVFSQKANLEADSVKTQELISYLSKDNIESHLRYLASDDLGGRGMLNLGNSKASSYIQNHFHKIGLKQLNNSWTQIFNVYQPGYSKMNIFNENDTITKENILMMFGQETSTSEVELHYLNQLTLKDIAGRKLKNQALALKEYNPMDQQIQVPDTHAKFVIFIAKDQKDLLVHRIRFSSMMGNRMYLSPQERFNDLNSLALKQEDIFSLLGKEKQALIEKYDNLSKKERKQLSTSVTIELEYENLEYNNENVLGYIEGTDLKDEFIVVTAHYDHLGTKEGVVFNGANDNASGTSAIMEMAEAFKKAKENGIGPRRSILFIAFAAEEVGLLGSEFFCQNPLVPMEKIVANYNFDMVGRINKKYDDHPNYTYLLGTGEQSKQFYKVNNEVHQRYMPEFTVDLKDPENLYKRSDQYHFLINKIPIAFFTDHCMKDYHLPSDDSDKINYEVLYQRTKLGMMMIWEIANRNQILN